MPAIQTPKSVPELLKLIARHGKRSVLLSGIDQASERTPAGKVAIDLTGVAPLQEIEKKRDKVTIGTGVNLGRVARDAVGENGLLRQAASIIANPLVRNRVTLVEALRPDSPYFDITTPLVLLEAKVRLQSPAGRRTMPIRDFLEATSKGLKKGELPTALEFSPLHPQQKVGFFRVASVGAKGSVSAAIRMKLVRMFVWSPKLLFPVSGSYLCAPSFRKRNLPESPQTRNPSKRHPKSPLKKFWHLRRKIMPTNGA